MDTRIGHIDVIFLTHTLPRLPESQVHFPGLPEGSAHRGRQGPSFLLRSARSGALHWHGARHTAEERGGEPLDETIHSTPFSFNDKLNCF